MGVLHVKKQSVSFPSSRVYFGEEKTRIFLGLNCKLCVMCGNLGNLNPTSMDMRENWVEGYPRNLFVNSFACDHFSLVKAIKQTISSNVQAKMSGNFLTD